MVTRLAARAGRVVASFLRRASSMRRIRVGCAGTRMVKPGKGIGRWTRGHRISKQMYPKTGQKQEVRQTKNAARQAQLRKPYCSRQLGNWPGATNSPFLTAACRLPSSAACKEPLAATN